MARSRGRMMIDPKGDALFVSGPIDESSQMLALLDQIGRASCRERV